MGRQESDNFEIYFGHENIYSHASPSYIARETSHCLELLNNGISDPLPAREFLQGETGKFLEGVERGFLGNFVQIAEKRRVDSQDLRYFSYLSKNMQAASQEDTEAFNFTLVTFCAMPEYAEDSFLPEGFSRRGVLAPPFTLREFYMRIKELERVNRYIAGGGDVVANLQNLPGLRYTQYHKVGGNLPFRIEGDEALAVAKENFGRLLDGIEIDL